MEATYYVSKQRSRGIAMSKKRPNTPATWASEARTASERELCKQVMDDLINRLRAAGHTVGTEEAPDNLEVIDGIESDLHIELIERWGRTGVSVWASSYSYPADGEVMTDRRGNLDYAQVIANLESYLDKKRQELQTQEELERLRQRAANVVEGCGIRMHTLRATLVGKAVLEIKNNDMIIHLRLPIRHRHKLRTLVQFLKSF